MNCRVQNRSVGSQTYCKQAMAISLAITQLTRRWGAPYRDIYAPGSKFGRTRGTDKDWMRLTKTDQD